MKGLGLGIDMIINSYLNAPLSFNLGTAPTSVLAASGAGDESVSIRPLQFFEYDATNWGLLYLADGGGNTSRTIKLATSAKSGFAHSWTKQGTVIAAGTGGDWDISIGSATLVKNGSTWIVLYESFSDGVVGAATGTNLLSLTKHASNPLIDNTASSDFNKYIRHPIAVLNGGTLYCIHEGRPHGNIASDSKIGYATASVSDLTSWTVFDTVLIDPSTIDYAKGNNPTIANAMINEINGIYYMWFLANPGVAQSENFNNFSLGGISYAYSRDLLNWTIVGSENFHVYMGLFGYDASNSFYQHLQEVTPIYDGTDLSLYMWGSSSPDIAKVDLDGAAFENTARGFDVTDNFDDGSINGSLWSTTSGGGVTVSESGGSLVVSKDGAQAQALTTVVESVTSWDSDAVGSIVCGFDIDVSDHNSTDYWSYEISDATNVNSFRIIRSNTTDKAVYVIRVNSVLIDSAEIDFTGSESFKFLISNRNQIRIFRANGTSGWVCIANQNLDGTANEINGANFTFKINVINSVSSANTLKLNNIAIGEYDNGLVSSFGS